MNNAFTFMVTKEEEVVYEKQCPICKGKSYSATKKGTWICTYKVNGEVCNADLTDIKAEIGR